MVAVRGDDRRAELKRTFMSKIPSEKQIILLFIEQPTPVQVQMIEKLYRTQGWWQEGDAQSRQFLPRLIAGSHCFVVACSEGEIVGMGRAISDGISDAYIQDLTVLEVYRNQGIGRRILAAILDRLQKDNIHWIGLMAEPGSENLYKRAGFTSMNGWSAMLLKKDP